MIARDGRVGPWERRRLAGIFSAFGVLFFAVFFEKCENQFDRNSHAR